MRQLTVLAAVFGLLTTVLFATDAYGAPTSFTLSETMLMSLDDTYVLPFPGWADVVDKTYIPGSGVEYEVELYGITEIELGIGGRYNLDLSGYTDYYLNFRNTSVDDTFSAALYIKTGPAEKMWTSGWWTILPEPYGGSATVSLDLTSVDHPEDVREIGFGVRVWMGNEPGMADNIRYVLVETETAVPEASTLMLFGSGLAGVLAVARRKFVLLRK